MMLDNEWNSQFYVCDDYIPLEEEDDDWLVNGRMILRGRGQ